MVTMRSRLEMIGRKHVEKRGLSGAGTAGDEDVETRLYAALEEFEHGRGQGLVGDQVVCRERIAAETANGKARAIDGERRNDGINAGTVGEPSVYHRRGFIDAASNGGNDAIDDAHQVSVIAKLNVGGISRSPLRST